MNASKVALGILSGIAIGAIAGILFAPTKGSKTRNKIISKGNCFSDGLKERLEEIYKNANSKYETLLQDAKQIISTNETKLK
jgi:gas vesicle protein